jgi:type VI secretion system protein ImpH
MRAWEKYRLPAAYERADGTGTDPITEALFALVGLGTGHLRRRLSVNDQVLLHYAGHFSHWPRPAVALEAILSDYLARPVTIEQFRGRWSVLAVDDQSRLGSSEIDEGRYCRLGLDAVVGDRVWDIQGSFRIRIGPLTYAEFRQFMGEGAMLRKLADLARMFVGAELNFDVQLTLARLEVPECRLGGEGEFYEPRLGWNTWLKGGEYARDASDAVFQTDDL